MQKSQTMSTAETQRIVAMDTACGHCSHINLPDAKYCGGCGHSLFEACSGCGDLVRLNSRFCGVCGQDLSASLAARLERYEQGLIESLNETKKHLYDQAIDRLKRIASETDYRFATLATQAQAALDRVKQIKQQTTERVAAAMASAADAVKRDDKPEVVRLLSIIPDNLLDADSRSLLAKTRAYLGEVEGLGAELKLALGEKNWPLAGGLLERLQELCPSAEAITRLAPQIASRLIVESNSLYAKQDYAAAVDRLDAVPTSCHDDAYHEARNKIQLAEWLSTQFRSEPYATPTLGRLAVRLSKHTPDDPAGKQLATQLASKLKEAAREPRQPFPAWTGSRQSAIGGDVGILGWPLSIDCKGDPNIKRMPARYSVAFGLALQGLGLAKVTARLGVKKGLLAGFGSMRKAKTCWGIDFGNGSIKAVLLQRGEKDEVVAIDSYFAELPIGTKLGKDSRGLIVNRDAISQFIASKNFKTADVWVNFPARELLPRFLELPPVDDKKATALLEAEVAGQFPVAAEDLEMIKWFADKPSHQGMGRPAVIIAARKLMVQQRLDFLNDIGLKVTGMQCEPVALVNFVHFEFAKSMVMDEGSRTIPAIAVVDAGAASVTLVVVDQEGFWFRTIEGCGDDMTMALARTAKVTADEAEKLKRDPASLELPSHHYEVVEVQQDTVAARLLQLSGEPIKERRDLRIQETWVVGGACLAHGWIRRALCKQ